jgi:hypothetical protein
MDRVAIKKRILDGINDDADSPVFFTDAQLNTLIDEASEFVVAETRGIRRSSFLPLRDSTTFYSLRSLARDIMLPYRIWNHANSSRLTVTSMEELDQFQQRWLDTAGDPEFWFSVSWDLIGIYPRPTSDGGVLRIDYFAWPETLSDDASIPESTTHDAIVLYGTYIGLLKQWDTQKAAEAFKRLQKNELFDKAKSGILRVGHRSFGRMNLDLPHSIKNEVP